MRSAEWSNHTVLDATSALKFIQDNWRLAPLTTRDGSASSIAGAFDFGSAPRAAQLLPVAAVESGPPVGAVGAVYLDLRFGRGGHRTDVDRWRRCHRGSGEG